MHLQATNAKTSNCETGGALDSKMLPKISSIVRVHPIMLENHHDGSRLHPLYRGEVRVTPKMSYTYGIKKLC